MIRINSISLSFPDTLCFSNFSATIHTGNRIALIGQNGTGKTSLLKLLNGTLIPTQGSIVMPNNLIIGYVPQLIHSTSLSGAEQFNTALSHALSKDPEILILDEPTNHLDPQMKKALLRKLSSFKGTLIIASHDELLLRTIPTEIWHLVDGTIYTKKMPYDAFLEEQRHAHTAITSQIKQLNKNQKKLRKTVQHEQKARSQRRKVHSNENDRCLIGSRKESASQSLGSAQGKRNKEKMKLSKAIQELTITEVIKPTFTLHAPKKIKKHRITVHEGTCGYNKPLLNSINITLQYGERIAITGPNASGKTTLLKALMNDPSIVKTGTWLTPNSNDIGYLDQHYKTLIDDATVIVTIENVTPTWSYDERRKLLSTFLFRKTEEVEKSITHLSGGEKARLSLACIAAQNPSLLIIDEITNNLDRETREHVIQVLNAYTGTIIIVSHDELFLERIAITRTLNCRNFNQI